MTSVSIWGRDTCNTIIGSFEHNSGAMVASVRLCPGLYNVEWDYIVSGSSSSPLAGGSWSVVEVGLNSERGGRIDHHSIPCRTWSDTLIDVIDAPTAGWYRIAEYHPTLSTIMLPGGGGNGDITVSTNIQAILTVRHVGKVR